jgi:hypothetical protein
MEAAREKTKEMEEALQNIVERLGGQASTTSQTSQQENGRSLDFMPSPAREELSAAEPPKVSSDRVEPVMVGPFGAISYQKLPHPLGPQIKELPVVDGSNVDKLLEFFTGVFRLKQVGQWNVPTIYELLYPHCRGEILDLLIKAVQNRDSFEKFHGQVLEQIIPLVSYYSSEFHVTREYKVLLKVWPSMCSQLEKLLKFCVSKNLRSRSYSE